MNETKVEKYPEPRSIKKLFEDERAWLLNAKKQAEERLASDLRDVETARQALPDASKLFREAEEAYHLADEKLRGINAVLTGKGEGHFETIRQSIKSFETRLQGLAAKYEREGKFYP